jgi:hypothetical protein
MKLFELLVYYFIKGVIVVGLLVSALYGDWTNVFWIGLIFLATFIPTVIKKQSRLYFPLEFELFIVLFIFLALFLGEIHYYYHIFWWWDLFLHGQSGILVGILGFIIAYILNEQSHFRLKMKPAMTAVFAFNFTLAFGVLWEIFEFTMDQLFGTNMQKSGLMDTMFDLILNTFGALVISLLGYLWMRKVINFWIFDKSISKFIKYNRHLFHK